MVNENDLRTIIAQVLQEMNLDSKKEENETAVTGCASCQKRTGNRRRLYS